MQSSNYYLIYYYIICLCITFFHPKLNSVVNKKLNYVFNKCNHCHYLVMAAVDNKVHMKFTNFPLNSQGAKWNEMRASGLKVTKNYILLYFYLGTQTLAPFWGKQFQHLNMFIDWCLYQKCIIQNKKNYINIKKTEKPPKYKIIIIFCEFICCMYIWCRLVVWFCCIDWLNKSTVDSFKSKYDHLYPIPTIFVREKFCMFLYLKTQSFLPFLFMLFFFIYIFIYFLFIRFLYKNIYFIISGRTVKAVNDNKHKLLNTINLNLVNKSLWKSKSLTLLVADCLVIIKTHSVSIRIDKRLLIALEHRHCNSTVLYIFDCFRFWRRCNVQFLCAFLSL